MDGVGEVAEKRGQHRRQLITINFALQRHLRIKTLGESQLRALDLLMKCHSEMSLRAYSLEDCGICWGKPPATVNGLRISRSQSNRLSSNAEVVEMIDVLLECDPGIELGWVSGTEFATT
jgi:hypothetical protein